MKTGVAGKTVRTGSFLVLAAVACGCAPGLKEMQDDLRRTKSSLDQIRVVQADTTAELSSVRADMRALTGRLDELERRVGRGGQGYGARGTGYDSFGRPDAGGDSLNPSVTPMLPGQQNGMQNGLGDQDGEMVPGGLPAVVPAQALSEDEEWLRQQHVEGNSDLQLFSRALTALRRGEFRQALPLLQSVSEGSAGRDWSILPKFWLGVAFEGNGDDTRALRAYHEAVTGSPKHPRAALALWRQAGVFTRLGDRATAILSLKKLTTDFPTSREAELAKQRIVELERK